jgi:hypothetical protein
MIRQYYQLLTIGILSTMLYTTQLFAYSYIVQNETDHKINVMVEVGVRSEKQTSIPARESATIVFDGAWSGLCIRSVHAWTDIKGGSLWTFGCGDMTFTITQTANDYIITKRQ